MADTTAGATAGKIAVVSVRGVIKVAQPIRDTLLMMKLPHQNYCAVLDNTPVTKGMLHKVKDFVTWGELDEKTFQDLIARRGEEYGQTEDRNEKYQYRYLEVKGKKYKRYFRLNPPQKGYGRKGVKWPFKLGGALGYRGEKINDLIQRMV